MTNNRHDDGRVPREPMGWRGVIAWAIAMISAAGVIVALSYWLVLAMFHFLDALS
jgi:hypothetical protein